MKWLHIKQTKDSRSWGLNFKQSTKCRHLCKMASTTWTIFITNLERRQRNDSRNSSWARQLTSKRRSRWRNCTTRWRLTDRKTSVRLGHLKRYLRTVRILREACVISRTTQRSTLYRDQLNQWSATGSKIWPGISSRSTKKASTSICITHRHSDNHVWKSRKMNSTRWKSYSTHQWWRTISCTTPGMTWTREIDTRT